MWDVVFNGADWQWRVEGLASTGKRGSNRGEHGEHGVDCMLHIAQRTQHTAHSTQHTTRSDNKMR